MSRIKYPVRKRRKERDIINHLHDFMSPNNVLIIPFPFDPQRAFTLKLRDYE